MPVRGARHTEGRPARPTVAAPATASAAAAAAFGGVLYPPAERSQIRDSWRHLMRWSRRWRTCDDSACVLDNLEKVRAGFVICLHLSESAQCMGDVHGAVVLCTRAAWQKKQWCVRFILWLILCAYVCAVTRRLHYLTCNDVCCERKHFQHSSACLQCG